LSFPSLVIEGYSAMAQLHMLPLAAMPHMTYDRSGPRSRKRGRVNSRPNGGISRMQKLKKKPSKLLAVDPGFAERTGVLKSLRNQFPKAIDSMIKLLVAANKECKDHLHEIAFHLDGIVHLHRRG
jgi:hypothetical protein